MNPPLINNLFLIGKKAGIAKQPIASSVGPQSTNLRASCLASNVLCVSEVQMLKILTLEYSDEISILAVT